MDSPAFITTKQNSLISGNTISTYPKRPEVHRTTHSFKHNPEMSLIAISGVSLGHSAWMYGELATAECYSKCGVDLATWHLIYLCRVIDRCWGLIGMAIDSSAIDSSAIDSSAIELRRVDDESMCSAVVDRSLLTKDAAIRSNRLH
jgi:hypothetical protein